VTVTYSRQYRRCGKPDCTVCATGVARHGPYWYACWREGSRKRSLYLGKQPPAAAQQAACDALRVQTLGGLTIWRDDAALPVERWPSKVLALCTCLLSAPGCRLERDLALEWLWPDVPAAVGAQRLRATVSSLRKLLDRPGAAQSHVVREGTALVLQPAPAREAPGDWLDAAAFTRAAGAALATHNAASCRSALACYRGEYLPEDRYADWTIRLREGMRRLHRQVLLHLAAICKEEGRPEEAMHCFRDVLSADPCDEDAAQPLLRLLALSEQRAEATRVYKALAAALQVELGHAPSAKTRAIYREAVGACATDTALPGTATLLLVRAGPEGYGDAGAPRALDALVASVHGATALPPPGPADRCLAFERASDAVAVSIALQRQWHGSREHSRRPGLRIALHTGEIAVAAETADDELAGEPPYGALLSHADSLLFAAHEGQILASPPTAALVRQALPAEARLRPLGAYRLKGSGRAEQVFQVVHPALPEAFPPLLAPRAHPTNLPAALTSFIGREREHRAVAEALARGRLVTLVGAGGCGKTRLALKVAEGLVAAYQGGVWFVDLAPVATGSGGQSRVARALAAAFGLREEARQPLLTTLSTFLAPRRLLLLLDNCEHVAAACAWLVAELLTACPQLQVLATSRERLRVPGEATYLVGTLTVPPPDTAAEYLPRYEAAALFLDRARDVSGAVAGGPADAAAIAQVCRRLDGIPLAIELAAARAATLPVQAIAERLDDCFHVLAEGPSSVLPRQRTMRGTLDWSFALLDDQERTLLRRLAVFAGGWSMEAAETVCCDADLAAANGSPATLDARAILDLLSALAAKSLVAVEVEPTGTRYRFLEPTRQYASGKLEASGEGRALKHRHLDWCIRLAGQATPGNEQGAWLSSLERELDNLRAALVWSLQEAHAPDRGVWLAGLLAQFWSDGGHATEGRSWLQRALSTSAASQPAALALALSGAGWLAMNQGDYPQAGPLLRRSLALYEELADTRGVARALSSLGMLARFEQRLEQATALLEQSLTVAQEGNDRVGIAAALHNLGAILHDQGDVARAARLIEQSLAQYRSLHNERGITLALANLGLVTFKLGDHGRASACYLEALALARERGDKRVIAYMLGELAKVAAVTGKSHRATRLAAAHVALNEAQRLQMPAWYSTEFDQVVAGVREALGAPVFAAAWAEGRVMSVEQAIAYALEQPDSCA